MTAGVDGRDRPSRRQWTAPDRPLLYPLQAGDRADGHEQRKSAKASSRAFTYKEDPQKVKHYGLLAEEVAAVYPELVTRTATGEVQTVKYQELIPMLLNELQRQELRDQRQELAELRALVGRARVPAVIPGATVAASGGSVSRDNV